MTSNWVEQLTHQVGRGIDAARHGKSDQWIADRSKVLGHSLSRTAISEYRRGIRKTISVSDWLVIAAALGVPPISLLFPGVPDGRVTVLPNLDAVVAFDAVQWVAGERQTIPEGFDVLFDVGTGEMVGHVEGRRDYRHQLAPEEQSNIDLKPEGDPSPEKMILDVSREIARIYGQFRTLTNESWRDMSDLPDEVRKSIVESATAKIGELNEQLQNLEERVKRLGGTVRDEEVTQYDDGDD